MSCSEKMAGISLMTYLKPSSWQMTFDNKSLRWSFDYEQTEDEIHQDTITKITAMWETWL